MLANLNKTSDAAGGGSDSVARFNLIESWPAPAAAGNNVMQQEWELVYESIQR